MQQPRSRISDSVYYIIQSDIQRLESERRCQLLVPESKLVKEKLKTRIPVK